MLTFLLPRILQVATLVTLGQAETKLMEEIDRERVHPDVSLTTMAAPDAANQFQAGVEGATRDSLDMLESHWRDILTSRRAGLWEEIRQDAFRRKQQIVGALHTKLEDEVRRWTSSTLAENRAVILEHIRKEYDARPRYRVWQILLELNRGRYTLVVLAVILIVFNLLRMTVTLMVGSLREAEERSGITPTKKEYALVYRLHLGVSTLWYVAISDLLYHFWKWLTQVVVA